VGSFDSVGLAARVQVAEVFMFEGLFQPMHLLVIFFIALLVFGPKKLPELGKGIGEGIRALKSGMKEVTEEQAKAPTTPVETKAADTSSHVS
jgi:sec-independent protein translocase protein TatA